jgi:putative transposase
MDVEILAARETLYEQAKAERPERWSGQTRDWSRPEVVMLNPDKPVEKSGVRQQEMA